MSQTLNTDHPVGPRAGLRMRNPLPRLKQLATGIAREPLVQFLALGALIFVAASAADRRPTPATQTIHVDRQVERHLNSLYFNQFGALPDKETLARLTDTYVQEEVLYREALRLGLDKSDEIVRQRMVQKMKFLLADQAMVGEPSDEVLRAYYMRHAKQFAKSGTVTFRQIYFRPSADGDKTAKERAFAALRRLDGNAFPSDTQLGDSSPLKGNYAGLDKTGARTTFGDTPLVDAVFAAPLHQWSGPYQSGYGWHLVFITAREGTTALPFESVRDQVKAAWLDETRKTQDRKALAALEAKYKVVSAPEEATR